VIQAAIAFGNDTDVTCVAGGLAGIRFGFSGIPSRWLMQLRGFSIATLPNQFLKVKYDNDFERY
jgi:ADP-ribosylglycohydrolase